jgi:hypothetical protein
MIDMQPVVSVVIWNSGAAMPARGCCVGGTWQIGKIENAHGCHGFSPAASDRALPMPGIAQRTSLSAPCGKAKDGFAQLATRLVQVGVVARLVVEQDGLDHRFLVAPDAVPSL